MDRRSYRGRVWKRRIVATEKELVARPLIGNTVRGTKRDFHH